MPADDVQLKLKADNGSCVHKSKSKFSQITSKKTTKIEDVSLSDTPF